MRRGDLRSKLEDNPIIIAITDEDTYKMALESDDEVVFLLDANIANVKDRVEKLIEHGKFPFLHIDMIPGITSTPPVVDYIADTFKRRCGIITTKPNLVKKANQVNLRVVHRAFIVDSKSKNILIDNIRGGLDPDAVEIMPACLPKVIAELKVNFPTLVIIAGGLLTEKQEGYEILNSGATAISTSCRDIISE